MYVRECVCMCERERESLCMFLCVCMCMCIDLLVALHRENGKKIHLYLISVQ